MGPSIPVIYYHSVADHSDGSKPWAFLSVGTRIFRAQMRVLKLLGYRSCTWEELYEHIMGKNALPPKTFHIQFDDGFLDNWTVVFPIMQRLGFRYTVLPSVDFVERSERVRNFVDKTDHVNRDDWWGYLSEDELKTMQASGLVDIQSHAKSHTWLPSSDKIVARHEDLAKTPWVQWNLRPTEKPRWLSRQELLYRGFPVFEAQKSLECERAFLLHEEAIERFCKETDKQGSTGGAEMGDILAISDQLRLFGVLGRYETAAEADARHNEELAGSKIYFEKLLGKPVDFLVWPGGGSSQSTLDKACAAGYLMCSKGGELNTFNSGAFQISRVAGFHNFGSSLNLVLNIMLILYQVKRAEGASLVCRFHQLIKKYSRR